MSKNLLLIAIQRNKSLKKLTAFFVTASIPGRNLQVTQKCMFPQT
jgi:hypothetical protein